MTEFNGPALSRRVTYLERQRDMYRKAYEESQARLAEIGEILNAPDERYGNKRAAINALLQEAQRISHLDFG